MPLRHGLTARRIGLVAASLGVIMAPACRPAATSNEISSGPPALRESGMRYLEPGNVSISSPVSTSDLKRDSKFIIVRIARVENPRRVPLSFTVSFRPPRAADMMLGTFSLYPADHPGRFLVATQGKVEPGGEIILELNDAGIESMKQVRVGVASLVLGSQ